MLKNTIITAPLVIGTIRTDQIIEINLSEIGLTINMNSMIEKVINETNPTMSGKIIAFSNRMIEFTTDFPLTKHLDPSEKVIVAPTRAVALTTTTIEIVITLMPKSDQINSKSGNREARQTASLRADNQGNKILSQEKNDNCTNICSKLKS